MHFCYVIYSKSLDRFYIGETSDFERRLFEHNAHFFKHASTVAANDWEEYLVVELNNIIEAKKLEKFIKRMKSKKFILRLKTEDGLLENLIGRNI